MRALALMLCVSAGAAAPAAGGSPGTRAAAPADVAAGTLAAASAADGPSTGAAQPPRPFYANSFPVSPSAAALTEVGRRLFVDSSLSASGSQACATCHDARHGFGPPDSAAVRLGGIDGRQPGLRAVMSLTYTQNVPPFTEHYVEDEGDDSIDQGPAGGRTWDGRSQSAHDQARVPLLSPFEMANRRPEDVVARVRRSPNARLFRDTFGATIFDDPAAAFKAVLLSLETYQQSPADFYPYSSKYDAYLRGQAALDAREARGLRAFIDPARGNCSRCHSSELRAGAFPQFTDFGFAALGVPRNPDIPANADPGYHDLGLCGPLRKDLAADTRYCGMFRTPSLRNVALRRVFFHNGVLHRLRDAVRFYAERDARPENWYPKDGKGRVRPFDDLPPAYRANVDRDAPFGQRPGGRPTLSARDVGDITAFLATLTDGYSPAGKRVSGATPTSLVAPLSLANTPRVTPPSRVAGPPANATLQR